jgi:hypothetical protein
MDLEFSAEVFSWRGPAPYHFVRVPEDEADQLRETASAVSYGWGMIPVTLTIGDTSVTTALWPQDGSYVVPLKDRIRRAEGIGLEDVVSVRLSVEI